MRQAPQEETDGHEAACSERRSTDGRHPARWRPRVNTTTTLDAAAGAAPADRPATADTGSAPAFDLTAALDHAPLGGFRLRLIIVSWLVTFFDGFDLNVIAFASRALQASFDLTPQMLGNVFSAGIFGTLLGGFLFGFLGDRWGRRPAILLSCGSFSLLTASIALSDTYGVLLTLRFFNGLALGGVLPLIWALNVEYAPRRMRATIITLIMLGYSFGIAAAGPIARLVLPHWSWPGVFVLGGVLSFMSTVLLIFALPESVRFLTTRRQAPDAVRTILSKMKIAVPPGPVRFHLSDELPRAVARFQVSMLFQGWLRYLTPLLWTAYFASSMSTFFLASWGPLVLEELGFSPDQAAWVAAMKSLLGAAGGLLLMRYTDRFGAMAVAVLPLAVVPVLLLVGLLPMSLTLFVILMVPIAIALGGGHFGVTSIISIFYPSSVRANGAGWCSGVGKLGSVLGPLIGGYILATQMPIRMSYALLAVCPLVYGLATLSIGLLERRRRLPSEVTADGEPEVS